MFYAGGTVIVPDADWSVAPAELAPALCSCWETRVLFSDIGVAVNNFDWYVSRTGSRI